MTNNNNAKKLERRTKMIRTVIRCSNNMVMVFDREGEQIPEYQGQYQEVRESILKDAPLSTVFGYLPNYGTDLEIVIKEEW